MRIQQGRDRVQTTLQPGDRAVLDITDGSVTFYRGSTPLVMDSENETAFGFTKEILPFQQLCRVVAECFGLQVVKKVPDKGSTFTYNFTKGRKPKKK